MILPSLARFYGHGPAARLERVCPLLDSLEAIAVPMTFDRLVEHPVVDKLPLVRGTLRF